MVTGLQKSKFKVLAVIKKNYDFIELESIINFYNPGHLHLFIYTEKNNVVFYDFSKNVLKEIDSKFKNRVAEISKSFLYIEEVSSGKDIYNIISPFLTNDSVVVLPLANGRFFIDSVKIFSQSPKVTVCHISDGILDYIPRYKYFFIRNKFTLFNIFNNIISSIRLRNNLAEISFSVLSYYSAFSKKTIKIDPNRNFSKKSKLIIYENLPNTAKKKNGILLIPTKAISADLIIKYFSLQSSVGRVIISSKFGQVTLKGKEFWFDAPLTAEELLQADVISEVYAGPSTAAFYARELNSTTKISILSSYDERKIIGFNMENWLRKQCVKNDIKYQYIGKRSCRDYAQNE